MGAEINTERGKVPKLAYSPSVFIIDMYYWRANIHHIQVNMKEFHKPLTRIIEIEAGKMSS